MRLMNRRFLSEFAASVGRYLFTKAIKEKLDRVAEKEPVAVGTEQTRHQVARRAERLASVISGSRVLIVNDIPLELQQSNNDS